MTHVLSEAALYGHCYLPQSILSENVIKLLTTQEHQPTKDAFPLRVAEGIAQTIKDMALKEGNQYVRSFYKIAGAIYSIATEVTRSVTIWLVNELVVHLLEYSA